MTGISSEDNASRQDSAIKRGFRHYQGVGIHRKYRLNPCGKRRFKLKASILGKTGVYKATQDAKIGRNRRLARKLFVQAGIAELRAAIPAEATSERIVGRRLRKEK